LDYRLDAVGMLRVLAAFLRGDRQSCSMVRVPTPDEEDAKRTHHLDELARIQSHDVVLPTATHGRIRLRCVTQPVPLRPHCSTVSASSCRNECASPSTNYRLSHAAPDPNLTPV
jgi:hypothetical protein